GTPSNFVYTNATNVTLTAQWDPSIPAGDSYVVAVSTSQSDFANATSSITLNTTATLGLVSPLNINTTYYGHVASVVNGSTSSFSAPALATATLANAPVSHTSTWTAVNFTSITVAWAKNGNPDDTTYQVVLATSTNYDGSLTSYATVTTTESIH